MASLEQNSEPLQAIKGQELAIPWTVGKKETVSSRDHAADHIPASATFSAGQNNIKSEVRHHVAKNGEETTDIYSVKVPSDLSAGPVLMAIHSQDGKESCQLLNVQESNVNAKKMSTDESGMTKQGEFNANAVRAQGKKNNNAAAAKRARGNLLAILRGNRGAANKNALLNLLRGRAGAKGARGGGLLNLLRGNRGAAANRGALLNLLRGNRGANRAKKAA
ncbi:hypothetical protein BKA69DRAFT_1039154 [Paraphysoderma sedebokerense]|nr:hypothetical protein BKA69DRAFT_1039154 [Paraphysoderma sedebokerense]